MKVVIYGKQNCTYCSKAQFLSNMKKYETDYRNVSEQETFDEMMNSVPEGIRESIKTVPQIFIDGEYIGGYTEFEKFVYNLVEKIAS